MMNKRKDTVKQEWPTETMWANFQAQGKHGGAKTSAKVKRREKFRLKMLYVPKGGEGE